MGMERGNWDFWVKKSRITMFSLKKNLNNLESWDNPENQVRFGWIMLSLVWLGLVRLG